MYPSGPTGGRDATTPPGASDHSGLGAKGAAARLGVKVETIYAYVSRGMLHPTKPDGRRSLFDPAEVDSLRAANRADRSGRLEVPISTAITATSGHRLRYRGHDVAEMVAAGVGFEEVAELLWSNRAPDTPVDWTGISRPAGSSNVVGALPQSATLLDRLRAVVVGESAADPLRHDPAPPAVTARGRAVIVAMVIGVGGSSDDGSIARRLWPALTGRAATPMNVAVLDEALVLLADHDLAASTLAVRIAASTRADPYSCLLAGLGPMGGPLHGSAARDVRRVFRDAREASVAEAVGALVRDGHGLGHPLYPEGDPRTSLLVETALDAAPRSASTDVVRDVVRAVGELAATPPNVDFALAAAAELFDWRVDAPEAVFAIARSAGWIAHVLEEQAEAPLRFRPVARYTGPDRPGSGPPTS